MKNLKKKKCKKTVEAYACPHCADPTLCISLCAGDIVALNANAGAFAQAQVQAL